MIDDNRGGDEGSAESDGGDEVVLSDAAFRILTDTVPQVIWGNDADGKATYFNQRWYEYSGLPYEASYGLGWQAIVHPDDAPASVSRWQQCLADGEVFDTEYRLRRHDGVYRWFLGRNVPLHDRTRRVRGWFGTATDIEDLKQAEALRRESEERFRLMVEGASDYAMFLQGPQGNVTLWSAGAARIFGWTEAEALGQSADFIFTPEQRAAGEPEKERLTARTTGRAGDRRWHQRKDGSRFWADGLLMRLDDTGGNVRGFAKVARDATEQKNAEENLRASEDALRQALDEVALANEALERRVEERTHQLSERTRELAGLSQMRQELLRQLVSVREEEAARISRNLHDDTGQQVAALLLGLRNLKDRPSVSADLAAQTALTQIEALAGDIAQKSHRISFTLRSTALDDHGLVDALRNYTEEWSRWTDVPVDFISISMDGQQLPREIESTIYRIVQEALTNVMKHATGEHPATQVSVTIWRKADQVVAVVEDNGPGFDVESTLNSAAGKYRLSLFGMQEQARLARGTLDIEASPGEGTTIFLHIPLSDPSGAESSEPSAPEPN